MPKGADCRRVDGSNAGISGYVDCGYVDCCMFDTRGVELLDAGGVLQETWRWSSSSQCGFECCANRESIAEF